MGAGQQMHCDIGVLQLGRQLKGRQAGPAGRLVWEGVGGAWDPLSERWEGDPDPPLCPLLAIREKSGGG